ncbi:hypothetical protein D3C85_873280 [compost metagenome]
MAGTRLLPQSGGGIPNAHQILVDGIADGALLLGGGRHLADVIMDLLDLAHHLIERLEGLLGSLDRADGSGDARIH